MISNFHARPSTYAIALLLSTAISHTFAQVCVSEQDCPAPITEYGNVYQDIWDADQSLHGVPAILPGAPRDKKRGYVVVNEPTSSTDKDHAVISEVQIPASKRATYDLVKELFDNYTLDMSKPETQQTPEEMKEIATFIDAIKDTAPMELARQFIEAETGGAIDDTAWPALIDKIWFDIYDFSPSTPHRSGFEHVFVGEKSSKKLGGYHYWHKYYLDDKAIPGYANGEDNMQFLGVKYRDLTPQGVANPNVVTISHEWDAFDYENGGSTKLIKPTGGFMVGCSPEGLIALGLVAFFDPRTRKSIEINNSKYDVKLFKAGPEESSINTFYLIFSGFTVIPVVDDEPKEDEDDTANVVIPTSSSDVRIIAALINPEGDDTGKETVTLINVSNSPRDLRGWNLSGANGKAFELVDAKLDAGEARQFRLPANSAELTNKSAKITLKDAEKNVIHIVEYSKKDIKSGYTTVF